MIVALAVVTDLVAWAGDAHTTSGGEAPAYLVPVLTIAFYSTLLLRWRRPITIFVAQWTFPLICIWLPAYDPFAGLLLALNAVAARRPARWSVLALASTAVPFAASSYQAAGLAKGGSPTAFVQVLVLWLLLATAAWGVGRLSYLAASRAQRLRELQAAEAAAAVTAERMRLARELHDIVAHTVTIMMIQATGAKAVLEPGQPTVRKALEVIEDAGVQAMGELHRMLRLLRMPEDARSADSAGGGPRVQPDLADLRHLVSATVQTGRDVELVEDGVPGAVDPSVAGTAYRVVQEALTNAAKHGGPQADVHVRLGWSSTALEVEVTDHERGPKLTAEQTAALSSGSGLRGLRERVIMVGGTFVAGPLPGGYVVRARLPRHGVRSPDLAEAGHA